MKLIKVDGYQIVPTDEAMLIKPVRQLYRADRTKDKEKFLEQMSYVYYMTDPRSSYIGLPEEERHRRIVEEQGLPENFTPNDQLKEVMEIYKSVTTTESMKLLNSMRVAIQKISYFLEHVDLFEVDDKGKPLYSISAVTAATDKVPVLAKKLQETEKIVAAEIEEAGRARGGSESLKAFENGFGKS